MYFCIIKKYMGTHGEVCRRLKIFLNRPVVYATGRSKAVVMVLVLFAVYTTGRFMFQNLPVLALCPRVSSFLLTLWSPRLRKRELDCVLLVHLFVCFVRVSFIIFLFHLVSGVGCGLWLWHFLDFSINFLEKTLASSIISVWSYQKSK